MDSPSLISVRNTIYKLVWIQDRQALISFAEALIRAVFEHNAYSNESLNVRG